MMPDCGILPFVRHKVEGDRKSTVETARAVLKDSLRRSPISFDEIGRRMGHTRGYISRALGGTNPLTLETIVEALEAAGIEPVDYFAAVVKALTPVEDRDRGPSQAQIEETVLRTLRRLGWAPVDDDDRDSGSSAR
jgi:transcriptional regulator with XRE-family HTH domain